MRHLDSMSERNKDFAARQSAAGTLTPSLPRALPNVKAVVIGCAVVGVDPAQILGIRSGEAVVMRNIGAASHRGCWSSWAFSDESVRLPERSPVASFTSLFFTTLVAVPLAFPAARPC
jgi:carbonic anhydrase